MDRIIFVQLVKTRDPFLEAMTTTEASRIQCSLDLVRRHSHLLVELVLPRWVQDGNANPSVRVHCSSTRPSERRKKVQEGTTTRQKERHRNGTDRTFVTRRKLLHASATPGIAISSVDCPKTPGPNAAGPSPNEEKHIHKNY